MQHRDDLLRTGVARLLGSRPGLEVVQCCRPAATLLAPTERSWPDVVVLEAAAPGALGVITALHRWQPALRLVGLHGPLEPGMVGELTAAGLHHAVHHDLGAAGVVAAVRGAVEPTATGRARPAGAAQPGGLTVRETSILQLLAAGKQTREIAAQLGIARKTVENHKQGLFRKLGVQNQAHAVAIAIRGGILTAAAADG